MGQDRTPSDAQKIPLLPKGRKSLRHPRWDRILAGFWIVAAAIATATNGRLVQIMEYQTQTLFFEIRGAILPPDDIVILTIDEQSLSIPQQYYQTNPQQYADLKPLQAWPWQRLAYAQVIDKLMTAGARSVALDIVFASSSSYGTTDDREFLQVLQRYAGRVTLAAEYEQSQLRQGNVIQLTKPERLFWTKPMSVGYVNFPLEVDGKIHKFASEFPLSLAARNRQQFANYAAMGVEMPSFEQAVAIASENHNCRGAQLCAPTTPTKGDRIYFYGPAGTFEHIPFWHVLDAENWNSYLQQGRYFQNKIVIVGATAASLQDFHKTPFSNSWLYPQPMPGVEIQANAIASRLQQKAIAQAIPNSLFQGLLVLVLGAGTTVLLAKAQRPIFQLGWTIGMTMVWGGMSYAVFTYQYSILPTAVPMLAIMLCGASHWATGTKGDRQTVQLQPIAEGNTTVLESPEANNQKDELQKLLPHELVTAGKILSGRYQITKVLASGGFSETYIAADLQRPGNPPCVVKRLKPASDRPQHLQLASRLFQLEAETLETLGKHDQIPQLLAYFEQDEEFFLVQELIDGHPLSWELKPGKPVSEIVAIAVLQDLLPILAFVHNCKTIHRDIKPSNIMRRHADGKLVLIDFGAVKQVSNQMLAANGQTNLTVSIGTLGYAPVEQTAGRAFYSSDIYAVGMLAIKALTGFAPHELQLDPQTGEVLWLDKAQVSQELATFISKMVCYDYTQRYHSASEAFVALQELTDPNCNFSDRQAIAKDAQRTTFGIVTVPVEDPTEELQASTAFWQPVSPTIGSAENLEDVGE